MKSNEVKPIVLMVTHKDGSNKMYTCDMPVNLKGYCTVNQESAYLLKPNHNLLNDLLEGLADVKAELFALEMTKAKVDNLHTLFFKSVQIAERNALTPCERVELEIKARTTQLFLEDLNKVNQM